MFSSFKQRNYFRVRECSDSGISSDVNLFSHFQRIYSQAKESETNTHTERSIRVDVPSFQTIISPTLINLMLSFKQLPKNWAPLLSSLLLYLDHINQCYAKTVHTDIPKELGFQSTFTGLLSNTRYQYASATTKFIYYLYVVTYPLGYLEHGWPFSKVNDELADVLLTFEPQRFCQITAHGQHHNIQTLLTMILEHTDPPNSNKLKTLVASSLFFFSIGSDCKTDILRLAKPITALKYYLRGSLLLQYSKRISLFSFDGRLQLFTIRFKSDCGHFDRLRN